jgi:hypothetical protein
MNAHLNDVETDVQGTLKLLKPLSFRFHSVKTCANLAHELKPTQVIDIARSPATFC